jgi:hypothetical protein
MSNDTERRRNDIVHNQIGDIVRESLKAGIERGDIIDALKYQAAVGEGVALMCERASSRARLFGQGRPI